MNLDVLTVLTLSDGLRLVGVDGATIVAERKMPFAVGDDGELVCDVFVRVDRLVK